MQIRTLILTVVFVICLLPGALFSQNRCGTVEHIKATRPAFNEAVFEHWLQKKINHRRANTSVLRTAETYRIPVVVHIIHRGEAYGTGTNISDEQVFSQITVLNEDFQRLNEDASQTASDFTGVAGSMDISFEMARRTPEGLPTNGIVRVAGPSDRDWTMADEAEFKSLSYWDSNNYLNIWVIDMSGTFIGYAQFPISDLPGLEGSPDAPLTDGVTIDVEAFGSIDHGDFDLDPDYNKGRTTTHEVGHFFGLKHIWGDDGSLCMNNGGSSDYVDDTPDQGNNSVGCPSPGKTNCNGILTMYQNYMDYTDDECMNIFTVKQIERMAAVIESSPRRLSLLSSNGLDDPDPVTTENITVKSVNAPVVTSAIVADISVRIKNNGVDINNFKVRITHNGVISTGTVEDITFPTGEEMDFVVPSFTLSPGINNLIFEFIELNGNDDSFPADNSIAFKVVVNAPTDYLPLKQNFESSFEDAWTLSNPLLGMEWTTIDTNFGTSLFFNGFGNQKMGDRAWFVSPVLDLSLLSEASMQFDVSYASRNGNADNLKVYASIDGGNTFDIILYNETGTSITNDISNAKWKPEGVEDWERKTIQLESLVDHSSVRIAFVFTNSNGNNLYLDNIDFYTANEPIALDGNQVLQVFPSGEPGPPAVRLNLPERDDIQIEVINSMGQRIRHYDLPDALNQTVDLGLQINVPDAQPEYNARPGVYFVRVTTSKRSYVERFVMVR